MSGRKAKITETKYLDAVRKIRTDKDVELAKSIGVHRSNISRFKNSNPHIVKKGENILTKFTTTVYDTKNIPYEAFKRISIIEKWVNIQKDRACTKTTISTRVRAIYNVCKHLNIHPNNLQIDNIADLVNKSKRAYYADEKYIRGLSFLTIRKPIRSWFELMEGISGELLSSMGIHAEASKGAGSASKERVTERQRRIFDNVLADSVEEIVEGAIRFKMYTDKVDIILTEMKGVSYFMYYTATRIGSVSPDTQGCFGTKLNDKRHILNDNKWSIHILDKGEKGGLEWDKILIDDGINRFRDYVSTRFDIHEDEVQYKLKNIDSYMFPTVRNDYELERKIMRCALEKAGVVTRNPNHIWRHTFAQDFLHASDWNYELCASLGGWKDTGTLKKHYGKITEEAKERGLMKVMGLPVEDVTYVLRW